MQTANILLSLGGDHGNTVMKFQVTAAEIAVLRAIHGDESVREVEPVGHVKRGHRQERERLVAIYGRAKDPEQKPIVEGLFPGVAARVFETLDELDLDESFYKATGRLSAQSVTVDPNSGPTVEEWVAAGYKASNYPPSGYVSKSTPEEIAAAVAAQAKNGDGENEQTADEEDDDIEDMDDGQGGEPKDDVLS